MKDHPRRTSPAARPAAFARHARAALEKHVPETRTSAVHWNVGVNEAWARFPRTDGYYGYVALRRHLDWVSGEAGISREPAELSDLVSLPAAPTTEVPGFRIRIGILLHGEDRWWPAGESERDLVEGLEYLALRIAVKGSAYFRHWPGGDR